MCYGRVVGKHLSMAHCCVKHMKDMWFHVKVSSEMQRPSHNKATRQRGVMCPWHDFIHSRTAAMGITSPWPTDPEEERRFEAWNWLVKQITVTLCKIIGTQKKRQLRIDSPSVTTGHLRLIKHTNKCMKAKFIWNFLFWKKLVPLKQSDFCVERTKYANTKSDDNNKWWHFCVPGHEMSSYPWSVRSVQKMQEYGFSNQK